MGMMTVSPAIASLISQQDNIQPELVDLQVKKGVCRRRRPDRASAVTRDPVATVSLQVRAS